MFLRDSYKYCLTLYIHLFLIFNTIKKCKELKHDNIEDDNNNASSYDIITRMFEYGKEYF